MTFSGNLFCRCERTRSAEQRVIFFGPADGDADLVGQARLVEVSNENPRMLELEICITAAPNRNRRENEIRLAGQYAPAKLLKLAGQPLALGANLFPHLPR